MPSTILIVEDSENAAVPLEIALTVIEGMEILVLPTALEALGIIENSANVAALVTDLHMPQMDGFELIERVRRNVRYARLPIIAISGDSNPEIPLRLTELGADAFFPKPYCPNQIRRQLESLLNGS